MKTNHMNMYEKIPESPFSVRILPFLDSKYMFPSHWHEHTEIHLFLKNSGHLGYGEDHMEISEGDCVIINGNELHGGLGSSQGICSYLCLIIPPSFFEPNHIIFKKIIKDDHVTDLIKSIYQKTTSGSTIDILEIKGLLYFLVSYLIRNYTFKSLAETLYSKHFHKLNIVNESICYISEHYDEPLTTRQLATLAHLSEGYFCQIFKDVTGKTAVEYINHFRVKKAAQMLRKTDMTVTEIAFYCGFTSSNYFSRIYKKIKGENPQSTRNRE